MRRPDRHKDAMNARNDKDDLTLDPPLSTGTSCDVSSRIFLITGGTQGLGLAIAKHLQMSGASGLVLVSRMTEGHAQQVIDNELSEPDNDCHVVFVRADLSHAQETLSVVPRAIELLQQQQRRQEASPSSTTTNKDVVPSTAVVISGLVNAAATSARSNLFTTTSDSFDTQMALNVRAPFLLTQQIAQHMKQHNVRYGSIVNISSVAAYGGAPFVMSYSVSKAALSALTKNNAAELAPHGIRVNGIHMGWCYTDNEDTLQTLQSDANWIHRADASVPLGRILRPHDVAVTVGFLLSFASNMMTGSLIDLHPEYAHGMLSLQDTDARW